MSKASLGDFLRAIFFNYDRTVETPVLGETRKRPLDGATVFWAHRLEKADLSRMHHASLGLQKPNEPHQRSRRLNFTGGIGVVLDDVYEKVREPILTPTWRLETKPGSEQWGYLFDTPLRDAALHDQIIRAIINNGLSDSGMSNIVRWFRLPGSLPLGKKYAARLVHWDPDRRFPQDKLLRALGISSLPKARQVTTARSSFTPEDPVWDWLKANGSLRNACTEGWWEIPCPWSDKHSNDDERAYYLPLGGTNSERGFNCFHSHHGSTQTFLDWVVSKGGPKVTKINFSDRRNNEKRLLGDPISGSGKSS